MALDFKQDTPSSKSAILLIALLVVSLVLITGYAKEDSRGMLHNIQSTVAGIFTPVKVVSGVISSGEEAALDAVKNETADDTTITGLQKTNEELRQMVSQMEEYRQEAERLQQLLDLTDRYSMDGVTCRIIARSTDSWNQMISVNAGTDDGVRVGLPVISGSGLVGQVVSATGSTAEVRLLQDPQTGVAAMIQSNRAEGILVGSFDGLLYLKDVGSNVEVKAGDVVITSGLGGGFYRGILIGTVVKVDGNQGDENRKIIVEPNTSAAPMEEVIIVTEMDSDGLAGPKSSSSSSSAPVGSEVGKAAKPGVESMPKSGATSRSSSR